MLTPMTLDTVQCDASFRFRSSLHANRFVITVNPAEELKIGTRHADGDPVTVQIYACQAEEGGPVIYVRADELVFVVLD
jgi:hypothetical protein